MFSVVERSVEMHLLRHIHRRMLLFSVIFFFETNFPIFQNIVDSFFFKDFTETLGQELILAKATGVRTTAILPFYLDGGIYTTLRK